MLRNRTCSSRLLEKDHRSLILSRQSELDDMQYGFLMVPLPQLGCNEPMMSLSTTRLRPGVLNQLQSPREAPKCNRLFCGPVQLCNLCRAWRAILGDERWKET
ncbi:hypothetical protein EJ04DRAFT_218377 [Polyplosphaeria fusca]|uniref:Uncharacterized protein n=1 Tax=Polyplosphaeria fusca TaxID=682080 RepID=A0A9P4R257_9PLEO|nr:hypothetical protein EJ04DRAFT_218377 [Polyplosphaeria fusca]